MKDLIKKNNEDKSQVSVADDLAVREAIHKTVQDSFKKIQIHGCSCEEKYPQGHQFLGDLSLTKMVIVINLLPIYGGYSTTKCCK